METRVGNIGNYYGGLSAKKDGDKFFWSIENYDGHYWEEIPEYLYQSLIRFQEESK